MNNNISIIRNLSTLGIVFHHVICAFYGVSGGIKIGSSLPVVFSDITDVVRNISMSAFTFVSGYVLWYQSFFLPPASKLSFTYIIVNDRLLVK